MSWSCLKYCFGAEPGVYEYADAPWYVFNIEDRNHLAWNDFGSGARSGYRLFRSEAPNVDLYTEIVSTPAGRLVDGWDDRFDDFDVVPGREYRYRVASSTDGVTIDASLPVRRATLRQVGESVRLSSYGMSSVVCGRGHLVYQYMKDWDTKLEYLFVIDVEEPTAPVDLGVLEMSNRVDSALCPMHMRLRGGFLYACTNDSVLIFDVTDPTEPKQVSTFSSRPPGTNIYRRLELAGDYLYVQAVATPQRGADERHPLDSSLRDETRSQYILQIWNIGDLKNPVLSAVCWEPQGGLLGVHGDVLYTSRQVFDITSRTAPQQIADLGLTPVPRSICGFDGQYLYTDV